MSNNLLTISKITNEALMILENELVVADKVNVGRLTNNLGGLNFLLGKTDDLSRWQTTSGAAVTWPRRSASTNRRSAGRLPTST